MLTRPSLIFPRAMICIGLPCCLFLAFSFLAGVSDTSLGQDTTNGDAQKARELARQQFQIQEMIPNRAGGWIFAVGNAPRFIWRDVDEVRRLGGPTNFRARWFDSDLIEHEQPNRGGRWMVWLEGTAPNGSPFRRSFTLFAIPEKIEPALAPDLSVILPKFPGPNAPAAWREHQAEFDRLANEFLIRGLVESENGPILMAGIYESQPAGRPKRYVESTSVVNDESQLRLKLKVLGLNERVQTLQPPRILTKGSNILHEEAPDSTSAVPTVSPAKAKIDAFCREWVAATKEPFVTLIARRGEIITHEAFGNDKAGQPIDKNYRCWIASLTKTVTGIMFARFLDQKLIELDSPLSAVFPDFSPLGKHVPTFRQCLNHTSGLAGHGEFGGIKNPHLENVVLNGLDVNQPGQAHAYCGLGFELVAKAMEIVSGQSAARLYDQHLFGLLGFGDVVLRNASADAELTARELATLGLLLANHGAYGDREYFSPQTFEQLLPRPLNVVGPSVDHGVGLHWIFHLRPGAALDSRKPEDLLFSTRTIGHGSLSGCILMVDLEQDLVIAQVRKEFREQDSEWYARFFQVIAESLKSGADPSGG